VLISALAVVLGDNHSVRRIDATKTAGGAAHTKRMPLEEAVSRRWPCMPSNQIWLPSCS
jgi:hypothetical protein